MDINIAGLRALFEPFDGPHLLRIWAILAILIFIWGSIVAVSGGYPTARRFWKVHLLVLGIIYFLSGIGFLIFHIDPLLIIMSSVCLALVIQGDLGVKYQETPKEDWWLLSFYRQQMESEEELEQ